jgi:hypothetical protein
MHSVYTKLQEKIEETSARKVTSKKFLPQRHGKNKEQNITSIPVYDPMNAINQILLMEVN